MYELDDRVLFVGVGTMLLLALYQATPKIILLIQEGLVQIGF